MFAAKPQKTVKHVVYQTDLHCAKCAEKIRENVSFEKGVCDFSVDVDKKTVDIKFYEAKTDTCTLRMSINKLGYSAEVIAYE